MAALLMSTLQLSAAQVMIESGLPTVSLYKLQKCAPITGSVCFLRDALGKIPCLVSDSL